ncbi:TerD family protein [Nocardia acididurans]|uniref:TerD family protein n=1 Tax=Nocardia acididurans TaxID=2802282 RepID=UPI0027DBDF42|nr:TerD family protein [Nocardia acididurans]
MDIPLCAADGTGFDCVSMGLGWDAVRRSAFGSARRDIDLNASALLFSGFSLVDVVYHEQLISQDGSVRHHGDSVTGEGVGDIEVITVDLTRLSPAVTSVFLLVTSYSGQSFTAVGNAFCRLVDAGSGAEIVRYELSERPSTGLVMGALHRNDIVWRFHEIATDIAAQHPVEAVGGLTDYLRGSP